VRGAVSSAFGFDRDTAGARSHGGDLVRHVAATVADWIALRGTLPSTLDHDCGGRTIVRPESKQVLLLWDVDHTLIENSGVSKAVYARAFEIMTGTAPEAQPRTDGRTDYDIVRNLFAANKTEFTAEDEASYSSALIDAMGELHPRLMRDGFVLPGVERALEAVAEIPSIVQSVLTGNIHPNAEAKLRLLGNHVHLLDLDVGGYGSDDVYRPRLVGAAQRKASVKFGVTFGPASTVLVGDTERDVAAALEGGALIVGVATGATSEQQLRQAGAHVVLPDLTDAAGFVEAIRGLTGRELEAV
jgi:phosphoglycolate phosphatase